MVDESVILDSLHLIVQVNDANQPMAFTTVMKVRDASTRPGRTE